MKVIYVVDTITDLTNKIDLLKSKFGNNVLYVVKGSLLPLFKTYGYTANAVYTNRLTRVIEALLLPAETEDVIICYASLKITNNLLEDFIKKIGNKQKIVNVVPKYNIAERTFHNVYNIYVKSLFKLKDSLASPKLQFLPSKFVDELLITNVGNKLFDVGNDVTKTMEVEDKEINKSLKPSTKFDKFQLLPIIACLLITIGLVLALAFSKMNYLIIITFICLYVLDIVLAIIQQCKIYFDQRFFK